MRLLRRYALSAAAARAAALIKRGERQVALLDRARPLNLDSELERLLEEREREPAARFRYAQAPQLGELRRELAEVAERPAAGDVELELLCERAAELELEAQLAECVGAPRFASLAARRFPLPADDTALRARAHAGAGAHDAVAACDAGPLHASDDKSDPSSLWSLVVERLEGGRLPIRVELTPGLVSLAAVADDVVRIRPGARLSERAGRRVALHEVEGHARPRLAGRALGGVFWAGSRRGSEYEEGRSIRLEELAALLDDDRRRELWRRYLAAASVREGADFWQTVRLLGGLGSPPRDALGLSARVHRGGGLGRELIYASGHYCVAAACATRPALLDALGHGRVSVAAIERLVSAGSVELHDDGDVI